MSDPVWSTTPARVLELLNARPEGLSTSEADRRRTARSDSLGEHRRRPPLRLLASQFANPISLILISATVVSMALGDIADGAIIMAIIAVSGLLSFWQEHRADRAVARLLDTVQVRSRARRDGRVVQVPLADVVAGDVVELSAGDVVPGDGRILESTDLLVDASALTGESFPVDKDAAAPVPADAPLAARATCLYLGSHVVSGRGVLLVTDVGRQTELGRVARAIGETPVQTAFERGIGRFGWLLARIVGVLTALVFLINAATGRGIIDSLLFALSLAVGITPQMLPAIVALSLASGARRLAGRKVIVKRLDAIEDLGALTVLCTDKTGTITSGTPALVGWVDAGGDPSPRVRRLAALNAGAQRGFANPLDEAILAVEPSEVVALDELPYDFQRKRLSVLCVVDGSRLLITKGAVSAILPLCVDVPEGIERAVDEHCARGDRVLAIASRVRDPGAAPLRREDERGLTFEGLLIFRDPPKLDAGRAVRELVEHGVGVRLITGDSLASAVAAAASVGIPAERTMRGADLGQLDDVRLAVAVRSVTVFAEVEPLHKQRIVAALRRSGETVGFLGDGINDAPALHAADVGISVDTAVDVAKQAASVVLLDKDLGVLVTGVRLGRQTFANTLKYIRLTISANFGNMVSLALASVVLPFLPLLPRQILLLNFLSDLPAMAIASDAVDVEAEARPIRWHLGRIQLFMLVFGTTSTLFDLVTFGVLILGFGASAPVFQGSWFVVSTLTELAVLFSLRTARPIWASRPGVLLMILSAVVAIVTVAIPFVPPVASVLGVVAPSPGIWLALGGILVGYLVVNETVKRVARPLFQMAG